MYAVDLASNMDISASVRNESGGDLGSDIEISVNSEGEQWVDDQMSMVRLQIWPGHFGIDTAVDGSYGHREHQEHISPPQ